MLDVVDKLLQHSLNVEQFPCPWLVHCLHARPEAPHRLHDNEKPMNPGILCFPEGKPLVDAIRARRTVLLSSSPVAHGYASAPALRPRPPCS